ncbi:hypothetical protein V5O48_016580 [Marasmius crinis-equi]|uniref:DNA (cytosine-5-)-methyltransferase n=1 Tax=Marasmius crinis-equi TaxID=585013 RepID=A0ABR3ERC1_9AGAR
MEMNDESSGAGTTTQKRIDPVRTNLTAKYQPLWGDREGIRELVQNWYDGLVQQNRLGGFHEVEIVKTVLKKEIQFKAYRRVDGNKASFTPPKARGRPKREALGSIVFKHDEGSSCGELILYNRGVQLSSDVLMFGETDKRGTGLNLIGGHGEGMKVGILALVRNKHDVSYFTSGQRWKFGLFTQKEELRATITPNTTHKNTEGLRVSVKNLQMEQLNGYFDGILFLHPPPPDTILQLRQPSAVNRGYICTADKYLSKLYCKGLFVRDYNNTSRVRSCLHYGYDLLLHLRLGRDRDVPSATDLGKLVLLLWISILAEELDEFQEFPSTSERPTLIADRFLDLFENDPRCLDIAQARCVLGKNYGDPNGPRVVKHLWTTFLTRKRKEHGADVWVYDHQARDSEEQQKIIRSFGAIGISLPEDLLVIFKDHRLIRSPDEEQKRRFKTFQDSSTLSGPFAQHVRHLVHIARDCQPTLCGRPCAWKHAEDTITQEGKTSALDLDVFVSDDMLFLNDRNLSSDFVHAEGKGDSTSCPVIDFNADLGTAPVVCDCSAQALVNQIIQTCNPEASYRRLSTYLRDMNNLFLLLPRNLSCSFRSSDDPSLAQQYPVHVTLSWTTQVPDAPHFLVELCPGRNTLDHTIKEPQLELAAADNTDALGSGKDIERNVTGDAGTQNTETSRNSDQPDSRTRPVDLSDSGEGDTSNATSRSDDQSTFLTPVQPSVTLSKLVPGEAYTVQVCARRTTRVAYSVPTVLECPLDRVGNLGAIVANRELAVEFSPVTSAVKFEITVVFSDGHEEQYETVDTRWAHQIGDSHVESISVVGISLRGIRSFEGSVVKPQHTLPTPPRELTENAAIDEGLARDLPIVLDCDSDTDSDIEPDITVGAGERAVTEEAPLDQATTILHLGHSATDSARQSSSLAPTSTPNGFRTRAPRPAPHSPSKAPDSVVTGGRGTITDSTPLRPQTARRAPSPDSDKKFVASSSAPTQFAVAPPQNNNTQGSGADSEDDDDHNDDWMPETLIEPYLPHNVGAASEGVGNYELESISFGRHKITKNDLVEVQLGKSDVRGRRFLHFLLYVDRIWLRRVGREELRILECRQYLSENDFKSSTLAQDPTTFSRYPDVPSTNEEFFLVIPAGSSTGEFSVDIPIDDIVDVISVFEEYRGMEPEFHDRKRCPFFCSWRVGLHSTSRYLGPLLDDDLPLELPPKPKSLGVADFFCGAGGFSQGFSQSGWDVQIGVDPDIDACNTFKASLRCSLRFSHRLLTNVYHQLNNPTSDIHHAQVDTFLVELEREHIYRPCPTYTVALMSPRQLSLDAAGRSNRHSWKALEICSKAAKDIDAHHILIENAIGLVQSKNLHHLHELMISLKATGRQCRWAVSDAADFGAPTLRKRVFLIASKLGLTLPVFPTPTHGNNRDDHVTVREAISDLNTNNPRADANAGNPVFVAPDREITGYALAMGATDTIENHAMCTVGAASWPVAQWDQPACTLRAAYSDQWACIHPSATRMLSPREMARLMSFPDNYFFSGGVTQQINQIGSAVCPLIARAFGETFKNALLCDYPSLEKQIIGQEDSDESMSRESADDMPENSSISSKRTLEDDSFAEKGTATKRTRYE